MKTANLLITDKSNIRYLSNFTGSSGFMLLTKNKKYLFTDFRYIERAKNTIKKGIEIIDTTKMWKNPEDLKKNWHSILQKHHIKLLGVEEDNLTVSRFKRFKKMTNRAKRGFLHSSSQIKFINISETIENLREIKSTEEIKLIQKSQAINEKVFLEIKKIIQKSINKISPRGGISSLREIEVAWKIKELGHYFGAEDISFDPIVSFGKHTAMPHHLPDDTKLKKGDLILIDMGMKYKGYCSDMTRMIFTEKPTAKQKHIYELVLKAQEFAIKHIKAGISGEKADSFSRDIIAEEGFAENYGHAGGHGIGLDIHEQPSLSENYTKKLQAGSIITVEPGIYLEGEFGIRIEDMLLVQKNGNQNLTKINKGAVKLSSSP